MAVRMAVAIMVIEVVMTLVVTIGIVDIQLHHLRVRWHDQRLGLACQ